MCLCPGFVRTRIFESERHRPDEWQQPAAADPQLAQQREVTLAEILRGAMAPEAVAERVLDAIRTGRFYILTHAGSTAAVERRMRAILEGVDPPVPPPLSFARSG